MMDFTHLKPIELADREALEGLYRRYGHGDSAHAFPSLRLWQGDMALGLVAAEEVYTVHCAWKGEGSWFFPVGSDPAKAKCIESLLYSGLQALCYVTAEDARFLETHFPGALILREAPEDSEYLYDRQEMIDLPGRRFVKIRNMYRRLEREHSLMAEAITPASLRTVAEINGEWRPAAGRQGGVSDAEVMSRLLEEWEPLGLRGIILRLDGEPWAAAAGYPLTENIFDCCLMKAKANLPGVTEHLRAALARALPEKVSLVNFEEDLGLEGLRLMKTRFRPCGMVRMFTAEARQAAAE